MTMLKKTLLLALLGGVLTVASVAGAQAHGGGGGGGRDQSGGGHEGGGQPGFGNMGGGMNGRGGLPATAGGFSSRTGSIHSTGSLQTGPVGRWWDDKGYSGALNLRPEQKKRMDTIFSQNRAELAGRYQSLVQEESKLESVTRDSRLNQGTVFGQIDRVAQARDALEKTNTRLMGAIRKELDPDQISRLNNLK